MNFQGLFWRLGAPLFHSSDPDNSANNTPGAGMNISTLDGVIQWSSYSPPKTERSTDSERRGKPSKIDNGNEDK